MLLQKGEKMSIVHTSKTSPLKITTPEGFPGLGMSICPGKVDPCAMSGSCNRDLATDIARIQQWGARIVVTLMEDSELSALHVKNLGHAVKKAGMTWWHFTVVDGSALKMRQSHDNCHTWDLPCALLRLLISLGGKIFIHCRGGLGRTGTLAARILIEEGCEPEKAISLIRKARPGAIETIEQEAYLLNLPPILDANKRRNIVRAGMLGGAIGDAIEHSITTSKKIYTSASDCINHIASLDTLQITQSTLLSLFTTEALIRSYTSPAAACPRLRPLHAKMDNLLKKLGNTKNIEANKLRILNEHAREAMGTATQRLKYLYPELCMQYIAIRDWHTLQSNISTLVQSKGNGSLFLAYPNGAAGLQNGYINKSFPDSKTFFPTNSNKGCLSIARLTPIGLISAQYNFFPIGDKQHIIRTDDSNDAQNIYQGDFRLGFSSSRLTHSDPITSLVAGVWVRLVSLFAFDNAPTGERLEKLLKDISRYTNIISIENSLHELIYAAFTFGRKKYLSKNTSVEIPSQLGTGSTADEALAIALYCTIAHRRYEDAVFAAAKNSKNYGGIQILISQLWGLLHGQKGFPTALISKLRYRSSIIAMADTLSAISYSQHETRMMAGELWPNADFSSLLNQEVNAPHHSDTLEGYAAKEETAFIKLPNGMSKKLMKRHKHPSRNCEQKITLPERP